MNACPSVLRMTKQEQKQIPFGDDKAKGNDRDSEPSAQNDEQTKANTEILAFDFSQARMTNKRNPLMPQ